MTFIVIAAYVIFYCIQGSIWGWATNKIVENKGYHENWFWWGFFFGLIALIVALTKPDVPKTTNETTSYFGDGGSIVNNNYAYREFSYRDKIADVPAGWRCVRCGKINAGYVGTCGCGCDKSGNMTT